MQDQHRNDRQRVAEAVQQALEAARRLGASAAEASASMDSGLSVNVRLGEVETLEYHRGQNLAVTVYQNHAKGSASTADLSPAAVTEAVEAALRIARHTSSDPCAGLADPDLLARDFPDLDLYHPWDIDAAAAIELARACEAAGRAVDARITNSDGASVDAFEGVSAYGNTHGFLGLREGTRHSISCSLIAEDDGGMQRDYWYTVSRVPDALEAPEAVGRRAAERALRRLGGRKLDTRKAPVLFAPELARGLAGHFVAAISGGALYRKASFLLDTLGQAVFPDFVRVHEDPFIPRALGSAAFDQEGVATQRRDIVRDGVLQGYVLSSYSACKLGLRSTGNAGGVHNLIVDPGPEALDLDGLLRRMDTGLLVTELIGHGVNTVTGDYSRGAAGFWVEGGCLQYPVEEITIAGNLRDMFRGLLAVGSDVDLRGNIRTGSWLVEEMTIAGR